MIECGTVTQYCKHDKFSVHKALLLMPFAARDAASVLRCLLRSRVHGVVPRLTRLCSL